MKYFEYYLVFINIFAFAVCGIDKYKAKRGLWRVKERTLFASAILGGSLGLLLGMRLFRHKTMHRSFTIGVPLILACQIAAALYFTQKVLK